MFRPFLWIALAFVLSSIPARAASSSRQDGEPTSLVTIGPGGLEAVEEAVSRCPTFLWGSHASADAIELAVYRVIDARTQEVEGTPALWTVLDGRAPGWTPTRGQCLEQGSTYAWSVRSLGVGPEADEDPGEWAAPRWLSTPGAPSADEIARMMELIEHAEAVAGARYRSVAGLETGSSPATASASAQSAADGARTPDRASARGAAPAPRPGSFRLTGDVVFSDDSDHDLGVGQREGTDLPGNDLGIRAGDASAAGSFPRAGGHLVLQAGASENSFFSAVRAGDLVLRSGTNRGGTTLTGGDLLVQIGTILGAYETVLSVSQGKQVGVASGGYLRLTPQAGPPVACNPSRRGSLFYDSSKDDLCLCNETNAWIGVTKSGTCP